jgi:lipopolysaccharide transport system permease protein
VVGAPYRLIFALNPMVTGIEGFRSSMIGSGGVPLTVLLVSTCSAAVLCTIGVLYFRRVERTFADVI